MPTDSSKGSTVIHEKCPICGRTAKLICEVQEPGLIRRVLSCGHVADTKLKVEKDFDKLVFADGGKPYPFQTHTMRFAREANFRCGIFHQMGLGKTICAVGVVKEYIDDLRPVGVLCKSALMEQWMREFYRVCGITPDYLCHPITTSRDILMPDVFPITVMSIDLLRRFQDQDAFRFKTLIIDECQMIKNPSATRTQLVRRMAKNAEHVLALSGTPIKNNAAEYFTILNILNPSLFYQEQAYLRRWVYNDGRRYRGLLYPKEFKEATKHFIIRYERHEVEVQLPNIDRQYRFFDLEDKVKEAYEAEIDKFEQAFDEYELSSGAKKAEAWTNVLAYLTRMREITGIAKAPLITDWVEEFYDNMPEEKLAIFVHHHSVANIISTQIRPVLKRLEMKEMINMVGVSGEDRAARARLFKENPSYKFLLGTTLASGEGLNLQSCGYCIIGEQEWNPANEEQAECRFVRIGATHPQVVATYFVAVGTVDEFMLQLKERKRKNLDSTLSHQEIVNWEESDLMTELAEIVRAKGRKSLWKAA